MPEQGRERKGSMPSSKWASSCLEKEGEDRWAAQDWSEASAQRDCLLRWNSEPRFSTSLMSSWIASSHRFILPGSKDCWWRSAIDFSKLWILDSWISSLSFGRCYWSSVIRTLKSRVRFSKAKESLNLDWWRKSSKIFKWVWEWWCTLLLQSSKKSRSNHSLILLEKIREWAYFCESREFHRLWNNSFLLISIMLPWLDCDEPTSFIWFNFADKISPWLSETRNHFKSEAHSLRALFLLLWISWKKIIQALLSCDEISRCFKSYKILKILSIWIY